MTSRAGEMSRVRLILSAILCALIFVQPAHVGSSVADGDDTTRINPDLLTKLWSARWITVPNVSPFDYGVYHFRRSFDLPAKPTSFVIHVTGDNRYQLFVNGERVVSGPARGDLNHWRFETINIASHLKAGKNVLAAGGWNFGGDAPGEQRSGTPAFSF